MLRSEVDPRPTAAGPLALAGAYFLYYATTGIELSFLGSYLRSVGLSGSQMGLLLGLSPALGLVAGQFWGNLADRTGRPDRVLWIIGLGAPLALAPMLLAGSFEAIFASLFAFNFFASGFCGLLDALVVARVNLRGGSYSHFRTFASLGFMVGAMAFGASVERVDGRVMAAMVGAWVVTGAWCLRVRARSIPPVSLSPWAGLRLLRRRDLGVFLASTGLHWVATAAYFAVFPLHVLALGLPPWVIGGAATVGVVAEIVVLLVFPRVSARLSTRTILAAAYLLSAVRWLLLPALSDPRAILALSAVHGIGFGAFVAAAVGHVAGRVPSHLRASGQVLFTSVTFGLGGIVAFPLAGAGYDLVGSANVLRTAALLELAALGLLVVALRGSRERP
jgi:MFS transporter, PPP family, 3-phenylpropionic acid transporter